MTALATKHPPRLGAQAARRQTYCTRCAETVVVPAAAADSASGPRFAGTPRPIRQPKTRGRPPFLSAFAALNDAASRTYYERKRAKKHNASLFFLARRRCDVQYAAVPKNNEPYRDPTATAA